MRADEVSRNSNNCSESEEGSMSVKYLKLLTIPARSCRLNGISRWCQNIQKATRRCALARVRRSPAESKAPCMHRNSTRENREAPWLSAVTNSGGPCSQRSLNRQRMSFLHEKTPLP